jgi:hypothetical protein
MVFKLTSNEPETLTDITNHGDRVLSCFWHIENKLHFSTYTGDLNDIVTYKSEDYVIP